MATKENENYLRIMLLLLDGGTTILRAFLRREVKRTKAGMDMITGCELWDFDHLCDTISHQFSQIPLATHEMVYVLTLEKARVYVLLANQDSAALDEESYAPQKYRLSDALRTLARCLDVRYQDYIEHKITQILSDPIDAETSITVLKKQFSINQEFYKTNWKTLKQIPQQLNVPTNVFDANAFELWEKSQEILDMLKHIEALLQEQNTSKEEARKLARKKKEEFLRQQQQQQHLQQQPTHHLPQPSSPVIPVAQHQYQNLFENIYSGSISPRYSPQPMHTTSHWPGDPQLSAYTASDSEYRSSDQPTLSSNQPDVTLQTPEYRGTGREFKITIPRRTDSFLSDSTSSAGLLPSPLGSPVSNIPQEKPQQVQYRC